jgi:hypothetical protein
MTVSFAEKCLVCEISHPTEDEFIQCVEKNIKIVDWNKISKHQKLSEEFIEKFQDKIGWWQISINQTLSESFIEKYQDKVDWNNISYCQQLSESFIERCQNKVDYNFISTYQKLSEEFIEKFQDKVNWDRISRFQNLPKTFIEKVLVKLNNPTSQTKNYIEEYVEENNYDIQTAIKRNEYQKQYKKHIITILQEDKIYLTEEFKNELFTLILRET